MVRAKCRSCRGIIEFPAHVTQVMCPCGALVSIVAQTEPVGRRRAAGTAPGATGRTNKSGYPQLGNAAPEPLPSTNTPAAAPGSVRAHAAEIDSDSDSDLEEDDSFSRSDSDEGLQVNASAQTGAKPVGQPSIL